jgi:tRNA threonylcarbamoyladenosine modification (KEOPS) complex Cgi121 subunit
VIFSRVYAKAFRCGPELDPDVMKRRLNESNPGSIVQTASAKAADNERLVEMLAAQTLQADSSGSLLAMKPEIDFLLRLAGTTQISKAIRDHGARHGLPFILVVAARTAVRGTDGIEGLELPSHELSARELAKVEKSALLNTKKA